MATNVELRLPYFVCALEILATDGYGGLKLAPLCRKLGVTTGAFYHSFDNWRDFTAQLLEHWHQERTTQLVELALAVPDPLDQLENLLEATINLPHQAEAAIRVWSALDDDVAVLQASVDRERYDVIYTAFMTLLGDPAEADLFSRAGMFLLVGFEQSETMRDIPSLEWSLRMVKRAAAERAASITR